jgi:predicted RNA-binding protein YlqC (UPF0109 family)
MAFSFFKNLFSSDSDVVEKNNDDVEVVNEVAVPGALTSATKASVTVDAPENLEGLKAFVQYVASALVDYPEQVSITTATKDRLNIIQISCVKGDIGKLVGKNGKTIAAIRALVSGAGGRLGLHATVDILE